MLVVVVVVIVIVIVVLFGCFIGCKPLLFVNEI